MSKKQRIIFLPFSKQIFPKKYFEKSFALNKWPQYKLTKWLLMGPFILFVVITIIPFIIWGIIEIVFLKKEDQDKMLDKLERFLKIFADMGFARETVFGISLSYKNHNANQGLLKVVYLKKNQVALFEKMSQESFWKMADEVWEYENDKQFFERIALTDFDHQNSFIVEDNDSEDICSFSYLNDANIKYTEAKKNQAVKIFNNYQKNKQRHPQIQLLPNDVLTPQIVYYYEPQYDAFVNNTIVSNLAKIDEALSKKGYSFMYLPRILKAEKLDPKNILAFAAYYNPLFDKNTIQNSLDNINPVSLQDPSIFKHALEMYVGLPPLDTPCFIRCVEEDYLPEFKKYKYSVFPLFEEAEESLQQKIDFYLEVVGNKNEPSYRLVVPDPEDPDEQFFKLGNTIDNDFKTAIDNIKKLNDEKLLFSSMVYIIDNLKDKHPELCKKINQSLYESLQKTPTKSLSRLVIDKQYRIFLPDFNNMEIEMGPLPKTVFIFLLNHPEGVMFKNLRPHLYELVEIYTKVGNRLDMMQIKQSIKELTDPRSNSINEKCSRIKEAFVSKMDDSIAKHYYVTGDRSNPKGIQLDRSLVHFPETK